MSQPTLNKATKTALFFYRFLWAILAPLLRFHKRMKIGYGQRTLKEVLPEVDLWIQAASVGEAYIVAELLHTLAPQHQTTILVTTNTSQGFDILKKIQPAAPHIKLTIRYCPLDQPKIIFKAVQMANPKLMILIESELWPGLLIGCKQNNIPVLVVNGRMTEKSMKGYLRHPSLWRDISPHHILAMSHTDAGHFQAVFGKERVSTMFNIKFDRLLRAPAVNLTEATLTTMIPEQATFLVFGSIREEEEEMVQKMIESLLISRPDLIIGLFPRHMERINGWRHLFYKSKIPYHLRSDMNQPAPEGTVILWNSMGELDQGYLRADAVFIGGSLAPLGGQNFLEPLSVGVRPVTGPSLSNFHWVGTDIFQQDLVVKVENWQGAVDALLQELEHKKDKQKIQQDFLEYAQQRSGGTVRACTAINQYLEA